jgi:aldehyde dehydrogenase (NAD+)
MYDCTKNYINGKWTASSGGSLRDIINPATERTIGQVSLGTAADVDQAVAAARAAFDDF